MFFCLETGEKARPELEPRTLSWPGDSKGHGTEKVLHGSSFYSKKTFVSKNFKELVPGLLKGSRVPNISP